MVFVSYNKSLELFKPGKELFDLLSKNIVFKFAIILGTWLRPFFTMGRDQFNATFLDTLPSMNASQTSILSRLYRSSACSWTFHWKIPCRSHCWNRPLILLRKIYPWRAYSDNPHYLIYPVVPEDGGFWFSSSVKDKIRSLFDYIVCL